MTAKVLALDADGEDRERYHREPVGNIIEELLLEADPSEFQLQSFLTTWTTYGLSPETSNLPSHAKTTLFMLLSQAVLREHGVSKGGSDARLESIMRDLEGGDQGNVKFIVKSLSPATTMALAGRVTLMQTVLSLANVWNTKFSVDGSESLSCANGTIMPAWWPTTTEKEFATLQLESKEFTITLPTWPVATEIRLTCGF